MGLGAKLCIAFLALFAAAIIVISAIYLDRTSRFPNRPHRRRAALSGAGAIFLPFAVGVPNHLVVTLDDLLVVRPDESVSGLRAIKANPSKPGVDAMLALLDNGGSSTPLACSELLGRLVQPSREDFRTCWKSTLVEPRRIESCPAAAQRQSASYAERTYSSAKRVRRAAPPSKPDHPGLVGGLEVSKPRHPRRLYLRWQFPNPAFRRGATRGTAAGQPLARLMLAESHLRSALRQHATAALPSPGG